MFTVALRRFDAARNMARFYGVAANGRLCAGGAGSIPMAAAPRPGLRIYRRLSLAPRRSRPRSGSAATKPSEGRLRPCANEG